MNDTVDRSLTMSFNVLATHFYTKCLVSHWPHPRKLIDFHRILPRARVLPGPGLYVHELAS